MFLTIGKMEKITLRQSHKKYFSEKSTSKWILFFALPKKEAKNASQNKLASHPFGFGMVIPHAQTVF